MLKISHSGNYILFYLHYNYFSVESTYTPLASELNCVKYDTGFHFLWHKFLQVTLPFEENKMTGLLCGIHNLKQMSVKES